MRGFSYPVVELDRFAACCALAADAPRGLCLGLTGIVPISKDLSVARRPILIDIKAVKPG
jgi:hypothetical protein